jgi:hypothetical protein
MRKALWVIPVLLLLAAIGAPDARADAVAINLAALIAGPPLQFQITAQAATDGFAFFNLLTLTNASFSVPSFTPNTTSPVLVIITKSDQSQPFSATFQAVDAVGDRTTASVSDAGLMVATPEPGTLSLMLIGVGLVLVMRKRIAQGLPQAT